MKRLYRSRDDRIIGGVCMGFARYLNIEVVVVRLLWVLAVLWMGTGVLAYLLAMLIIPEEPKNGVVYEENNKSPEANKMMGIIIIGIGLFLLARNFIPYNVFLVFTRSMWPFLLVIAGIALVITGMRGERR